MMMMMMSLKPSVFQRRFISLWPSFGSRMSTSGSKQLSVSKSSGHKTPPSSETRLVLLGKTGSGKSSTANTILGRQAFESRVSGCSVTRRCRRACGDFRGRHLTVLDTPGLMDTRQTPQEVQSELRRSLSLLYPGPHAFLLVIQIGRFTEEEKEAVRCIKLAMGSNALAFTIVVFTHGDLLEGEGSVQQCLIDKCPDLHELVSSCGGRYCVFNNLTVRNKEQVSEMLALVDSVLTANEWQAYSGRMLHAAEDETTEQLQEEMLSRHPETEMREWYERQLEVLEGRRRKELSEIRRQQKEEREKAERSSQDLEETFRQEVKEIKMRSEERKIHDMLRLMEVQRVEQERREVLQGQLDKVTKRLEGQVRREENLRRAMGELVQRDRAESGKKDEEKAALLKEVDKLSTSLLELSCRDEDRKRQMEVIMRCQREENELQHQVLEERQKAERKRVESLQHELKVIKSKAHRHRSRESHIHKLKSPVLSVKEPLQTHSTMATLTGFIQEMTLMGVNATLEGFGINCCIQ